MKAHSIFVFYLMSWNSSIKVSVAEFSIKNEINFITKTNQSDSLSSSIQVWQGEKINAAR